MIAALLALVAPAHAVLHALVFTPVRPPADPAAAVLVGRLALPASPRAVAIACRGTDCVVFRPPADLAWGAVPAEVVAAGRVGAVTFHRRRGQTPNQLLVGAVAPEVAALGLAAGDGLTFGNPANVPLDPWLVAPPDPPAP